MTTAQADKLIRTAQRVWLRSKFYNEDLPKPVVLVRRDRVNVITADGGVFDRLDLQILSVCGESDTDYKIFS